MLGEQELYDWFAEHFVPGRCTRAFRVEFLSAYTVGSDGSDYQRWLDGEAEPTWERKNEVLRTIGEEAEAGLVTERVKVITDPRTDYDRYACEWGYAFNGPAGEEIRVWDLADHALPELPITHDFWLLDENKVLRMHYDEMGRFEGASIPKRSALSDYSRTRELLWGGAQPFHTWYPAHPELLRARRAA